jgi:hypothetical protein
MVYRFARQIAGLMLIVSTLLGGIGVAADVTASNGATVFPFTSHHQHCRVPFVTDPSGTVTQYFCFFSETSGREIDTPTSITISQLHGTDCYAILDAATDAILKEQCFQVQDQFVLNNDGVQEFHYRTVEFNFTGTGVVTTVRVMYHIVNGTVQVDSVI